MVKPYSEDLRRRVVGTIEGGSTIPEAAEQCGISISSVVRFLKIHRETGSVEAAKFGGYKDFALAGHEDLVRQLLAAAGYHAGRTRRSTQEEKGHGRKVVDHPVSASFETILQKKLAGS
jgi:transposase